MAQYLNTKAENVLKRTADFIQSDQMNMAFLELGTIVSKFGRQIKTWHEVYEEVAKRFIKVAVELRKGQEIKNVLSSYRILCQASEIKSYGNVISLFLEQAEKRAQKAKEKSKSKSLTLERDLENEIPENILMNEVSGEDLKDRTDREIVSPWMRFLWETYRLVLELLKKDSQLEVIYHDTCQRAFKFCLQYRRKTEFKRLSDLLRTHVKGIDLSSYEGIEHYLSARFLQLSVAIDLDLWQDAFKSVEDIYYLISTSKGVTIPPHQLLNYYQQLTKIFWNSKNYTLHAYAQYKAFNIHKIISDKSELQASATRLLLSTLTTPSTIQNETIPTDFDAVRNERRLVSLLGLSIPPSKDLLLSELANKNVTQLAFPELKDLYKVLEVEFNPLKMCEKVKPVLEFVKSKEELVMFYEPLKQITVSKLLQQLSKAFQIIKIETVAKLADFVTLPQLEKILVENASLGRLQAAIDHSKGVLVFGKSSKSFDSEDVHRQLAAFGKSVHAAIDLIHPERREEKEKRRKKLIMDIAKRLPGEIKEISVRNEFIRMKKLWHDQEHKRALEKLEEQRIQLAKQQELDEEKLLLQEAKNREEERKRREQKAAEEKKKIEIIEQITGGNQKAVQEMIKNANKSLKKKIVSLVELDIDAIIDLKRSEIEREKKEKEKKLIEKAKSLDYLEITRREVEMPLFADYNKKQQALNKEAFDSYVNKQSQDVQKECNAMKQKKQELGKYFADKNAFVTGFVLKKRQEKYELLKAEQEKRMQQKKEEWEAKRKVILEEREKIRIKEEQEREKRKAEEEQQRIKDEQEREKRRAEEEERRRKREEIAEIQRKKEEEQTRKMKEKEAELEKKLATKDTPKKDRWGDLGGESSSPFGGAKKTGGYVPPHLRRQQEQGSSEKPTEEKPKTTESKPTGRGGFGSDDSFSAFGSKRKDFGTGGGRGGSSSTGNRGRGGEW